jgi:hypothetical protein
MAITVYYDRLTIPAGTAKASPVESHLRTAPGRLVLVRLYVPPGPRGEVSLWLLHQRSQVAPVPPSTWDNLDDDVLEFPLDLPLPVNETDLTLVGCSPNANFQHAIDFEVLVDTSGQPAATGIVSNVAQRILGVFGQ